MHVRDSEEGRCKPCRICIVLISRLDVHGCRRRVVWVTFQGNGKGRSGTRALEEPGAHGRANWPLWLKSWFVWGSVRGKPSV